MKQAKKSKVDDYMIASAIYILMKEAETNENKEKAKAKADRLIYATFIICVVVYTTLALMSNFDFDFSWAINGWKIYNIIFLAIMSYILVFDLLSIIENRLAVGKQVAFNYSKPFISFLITTIISNTISVEFVDAEPRTHVARFFIILPLVAYIMWNSFKIGQERSKEKMSALLEARNIIKEHPEDAKRILSDFAYFAAEQERDAENTKRESNI